jgi:copper chaperone
MAKLYSERYETDTMKGAIHMTIHNLKKTTLRSQELNCPSCVSKIESKLQSIDGVNEATVHFSTGRIVIEHDRDQVTREDLIEAVEQVGYTAKVSAF